MPVFGSRDTPRPIRGQYSGQVENVVTRFWLSFHVTMLGHNIGGGVSVGTEVELELDSGQEGGMITENPLVGNGGPLRQAEISEAGARVTLVSGVLHIYTNVSSGTGVIRTRRGHQIASSEVVQSVLSSSLMRPV